MMLIISFLCCGLLGLILGVMIGAVAVHRPFNKCPECKGIYEDGANKCRHCGSLVASMEKEES